MTNYNEKITKEITLENITLDSLKAVLEAHENDINDNVDCVLDLETVQKAVDKINKNTEADFYNDFCLTLDVSDRKTAFSTLIRKPSFVWLSVSVDDNGVYTIKDDKTKLVNIGKLEKAYRLYKSTETDKNGHKIPCKTATVFEALRVYGLVDAFTRNLVLDIIKVDGTKFDLSRIKIGGTTIFTEKDGDCFAANSKTALDKQLNIIVKFFGLDLTMRKTDLAIIKQLVLKIRQDKTTGKFSAKENNTLKMIDIIFGVMCSRFANENVKIEINSTNKDGKKCLVEVKEVKTETTTEA